MTTPLFPSVIAWNLLDGGTDAQDGNNYPGPLLQDYAAAVVGAAAVLRQSDGYHFHGWAPNQGNNDLKFFDYSGALNDAAFQTNLDAATAWANAGYLTQPNPTVVSSVSLVTIPALSFDYLNGDCLFMFWRGRATPEGADAPIFGDTSGTAANGLRVMVTTAGKLKVNVYQATGALSRFGGTGGSTVFEASKDHSFAFCIDGTNGKLAYWSDGVRDATYASGFLDFSGGGKIDTLNATSLKMGGDGGTSGSIQQGVACQHQSFVILKGRRTAGVPAIADLDALVAALHRNPQKLVTAEAW